MAWKFDFIEDDILVDEWVVFPEGHLDCVQSASWMGLLSVFLAEVGVAGACRTQQSIEHVSFLRHNRSLLFLITYNFISSL